MNEDGNSGNVQLGWVIDKPNHNLHLTLYIPGQSPISTDTDFNTTVPFTKILLTITTLGFYPGSALFVDDLWIKECPDVDPGFRGCVATTL
jgi:hypothetical protein